MDRRAFVSLGLGGLAWPVVARPAAAELGASEVARRVADAFAGVRAYRARFKQRYSAFGHQSDGTVWFARPDKLSFRYDNGNRVVLDANTVRIYERANARLYVRPAAGVVFPLVLSFLTAEPGFVPSFSWRLVPPERARYAKGHVLAGTPLRPSTAARRAFYHVDGKTFGVRRVVVEDHQRNRTRFELVAVVLNPPVQPDIFALTPPPGTRVDPAP